MGLFQVNHKIDNFLTKIYNNIASCNYSMYCNPDYSRTTTLECSKFIPSKTKSALCRAMKSTFKDYNTTINQSTTSARQQVRNYGAPDQKVILILSMSHNDTDFTVTLSLPLLNKYTLAALPIACSGYTLDVNTVRPP